MPQSNSLDWGGSLNYGLPNVVSIRGCAKCLRESATKWSEQITGKDDRVQRYTAWRMWWCPLTLHHFWTENKRLLIKVQKYNYTDCMYTFVYSGSSAQRETSTSALPMHDHPDSRLQVTPLMCRTFSASAAAEFCCKFYSVLHKVI